MTTTSKVSPTVAKLLFNLNSTHHKANLFYDRLGFPIVHWTDSETNPKPRTNEEALKGMEDVGAALIQYNERAKILSMVTSMCAAVGNATDEHGIGRAHVGLRVPGTATGRCGGTDGVNLQNIPKDAGYLTAMVPQQGHSLLTFDICYSADTEVLTDRGYLPFNQVTNYDKVAAVCPKSLEYTWEKPQRIIWKKYKGAMHHFTNQRGTLSVTEGHTMLWAGQQSIDRFTGLRSITKAEQGIPSKTICSIFTASKAALTFRGLRVTTQEIWIAALVQADSRQHPSGSYNVEVSRPAKVQKVTELLGTEGVARHKQSHQTLTPVAFPNFTFKSALLHGKVLQLEQLGASKAKELLKALCFWDGQQRRQQMLWRSTDKVSFDQVVKYFTRCGYTVREGKTSVLPSGKPYYSVAISKIKATRIKQYKMEQYEGYVGCVTVSTGFIMVRRGGMPFVSGNCALEPTVLTAASGDPTMNAVYGPSAPPGMDIYLQVGAQLGGELGRAITATGYDWKAPTAAMVGKSKKEAKKWRSIAKVLHLSASYGAGAGKIRQSLGSSGIEISMSETKRLHTKYWELFDGVKAYERHLVSMWESNGGWFFNPAGLPQAIAQDRIRDITNSSIQGGSHYLFMVMTKVLCDVFKENGIDYRPYVWDIHDCVMFTVPKEQALRAKELADGLIIERFNEAIHGSVTLRADANIVDNWWDDKKE